MIGTTPDSVPTASRDGRALALVNPASAGGRGARVWSVIESEVLARRPGTRVHLTRGHDDAEHAVADWAAEGGTELLVVGGDGTLHEAVNGLARARRLESTRLGVIPAGTGNDFARSNALRAGPEALATALQGRVRQVDVGRIEFNTPDGVARERVFLNSASVGLSVRGNAIAHRVRRFLPGSICYVLGGVCAVLTEQRRGRGRVRMEVDGREVYDGPALNLTVANGETFGSGLPIAPGASVRDGMLDQVVVGDVGRLGAARVFLALLRGRHLGLDPVRRTGGRHVRVRLAEGSALEADGYMLEVGGELSVDVLPGALHLSADW